jgi:imidazoleglycerol-phosphate dehydratase
MDDLRKSQIIRQTKETDIKVELNLGGGLININTGLPFFDHMLNQLAKHSKIGLSLELKGDLQVDAHHSVEDAGIVLGQAFKGALGEKIGIERFGWALVPLDETLIQVALDLSGRPYLSYGIELDKDVLFLGSPPFDPQLAEEFWRAFTNEAEMNLHINCFSGKNTHHILEASFKAVGLALKQAIKVEGTETPSTKGVL